MKQENDLIRLVRQRFLAPRPFKPQIPQSHKIH
jgi:hypothetical protein